jgi:glutaminase
MELDEILEDKEMPSQEELKTSPLFNSITSGKKKHITTSNLHSYLSLAGILEDDPRLNAILTGQQKPKRGVREEQRINAKEFDYMLKHSILLSNVMTKNLVIPEFSDFVKEIEDIYYQTLQNEGGKVADYIPQLARVNPDQFAVSICTIDGQRFSIGDHQVNFGLQSTCKPINYCLAVEELGVDKVHQHVGREPSGRSFNELSLNNDGLPHNPLINSGAIMCTSLIKNNWDVADRFDHIMNTWKQICGNKPLYFNNSVYLSERGTADRNFALAYFMKEQKAFPPNTDLLKTLELYFQCCSIESHSADLSVAAATLANAGINPLTGDKIFQSNTVRHCLSLMLSSGMYDFSGEFAFKIGIPAKSGVSGGLLAVIPNLMGISIWSPRLDPLGNSVRGVEFCERLIEKFNFHNYDSLIKEHAKINPRQKKNEKKIHDIVQLIWAASSGDLQEIKRLEAEGVDFDESDYDGRTALHLACAENQLEVVKYLVNKGADIQPSDRWGATPIIDAEKANHKELVAYLKSHISKKVK